MKASQQAKRLMYWVNKYEDAKLQMEQAAEIIRKLSREMGDSVDNILGEQEADALARAEEVYEQFSPQRRVSVPG